MGIGERGRWTDRWVAGALGGALLLGVLGARAVPPPPPLLKVDPRAAVAAAAAHEAPEAPPAQAEEEPGAGPALIWLLPAAGQLSGAPGAGE